jgi:hypothetical protein
MTHEKTISDLAFHLWHARGCPEGSADVDWAEAERQVRGTASGSADRRLEAPVPDGDTVPPSPKAADGVAPPRAEFAATSDGAATVNASAPAARARKKAK